MTIARAKSIIRQSIIAQVQWMRRSGQKLDGYNVLRLRALLAQRSALR